MNRKNKLTLVDNVIIISFNGKNIHNNCILHFLLPVPVPEISTIFTAQMGIAYILLR